MSGESDMEYSSDNECEYDDYYNIGVPDVDIEQIDRRKSDPEYLEFTCLDMEAVEKLLNETVEQLSNIIKVTPSLAKVLLLEHKWKIAEVVEKYRQNASALMIRARIKPPLTFAATTTTTNTSSSTSSNADGLASVHISGRLPCSSAATLKLCHHLSDACTTTATPGLCVMPPTPLTTSTSSSSSSSTAAAPTPSHANTSLPTNAPTTISATTSPRGAASPHGHLHHSHQQQQQQQHRCCPVCITALPADQFFHLACAHAFCRDCWTMHFETQIELGITTAIGCMATKCNVRVPEELVLNLLAKPAVRDKYQQFAFLDYVKSHPELRFCPGPNCQTIVQSADVAPKKATCGTCSTAFCYQCGTDYHAPTDCRVIRRWLTKCADDSETANYISAHTKDCPKCHICIEKNGGCNHMQCFNCKHDFCWMCVGDWKTHGSEYYECSRYKENPNIANESVHVQAREALKKYLHYYERWENHSKSLQLEQQTVERLKSRINKKVMKSLGTWIDWQHLFNAAALLARCRYTLQYTYPYAYFMEAGPRKELFQYQQAQLEAEIENLSWKIERAETTDRGDLENQMDVAEKRRITLIKDFFPTDV